MTELPPDVVKFLKDNAPPALVTEGDLTVRRAAREWRVSEPTALTRIRDLVKDGKLETVKRRSPNGRLITVYVPAKKKV